MKPLGWLILFMIIMLIVTWFSALGYSRGKRPVDEFTKLSISLLSIFIGIVSGFASVIPCFLLCCLILPIKHHNGHYGMPMGQYFLGIGLSVILGFSIAIVSYFKILKWRVDQPRSHGPNQPYSQSARNSKSTPGNGSAFLF